MVERVHVMSVINIFAKISKTIRIINMGLIRPMSSNYSY